MIQISNIFLSFSIYLSLYNDFKFKFMLQFYRLDKRSAAVTSQQMLVDADARLFNGQQVADTFLAKVQVWILLAREAAGSDGLRQLGDEAMVAAIRSGHERAPQVRALQVGDATVEEL